MGSGTDQDKKHQNRVDNFINIQQTQQQNRANQASIKVVSFQSCLFFVPIRTACTLIITGSGSVLFTVNVLGKKKKKVSSGDQPIRMIHQIKAKTSQNLNCRHVNTENRVSANIYTKRWFPKGQFTAR